MKNILVQYQGGGYSGCFWEWNYFYLDKNGKFHDIFSSGRDGIETTKHARELLESGIQVDDYKWTIAQVCGPFYVYDLTDENAIIEFNKECNPVNITGVLQWFCDNPQENIDFFVVCSACGERIDGCNDLSLQNWHGCGGIQSTADTLICCECLTMGTCSCCDEYIGKGDLFYLGGEYAFDDDYKNKAARKMSDDGHDDVCEGCLECQAEQIEQEDQEDMLFASRTTGVPDMFSDEMRWFWG